jgi:hemerythrin-like domain-containing protein
LQQALREHREMTEIISQIENDRENLPLQQLFIQLLEAHIRFEERILFPYLQEYFPEKLEAIAIHPSAGPACHNDADWLDHFWLASNA